mgnify:CR=1 FL=1
MRQIGYPFPSLPTSTSHAGSTAVADSSAGTPKAAPSRKQPKRSPEAGEKDDINEQYEQHKVKAKHAKCAIVDCVLQVFRKGLHWLVMVPDCKSVPRSAEERDARLRTAGSPQGLALTVHGLRRQRSSTRVATRSSLKQSCEEERSKEVSGSLTHSELKKGNTP